jgi:sodium/proline symporter
VILAYVNSATIFAVIQFAYMGLAAAFGIPLVALLWWEKITGEAVFVTILMGIISTVANRLLFPDYFPIFSMIAAVITMVTVTYLTRSKGTANMSTDESVKVDSDD